MIALPPIKGASQLHYVERFELNQVKRHQSRLLEIEDLSGAVADMARTQKTPRAPRHRNTLYVFRPLVSAAEGGNASPKKRHCHLLSSVRPFVGPPMPVGLETVLAWPREQTRQQPEN